MKELIYKYQLLKVPTASEFTPRTGFYALSKPEEVKKNNGFKQIMTHALWTDNLTSSKFVEVMVDLKPLYNQHAIGPSSNHYTELQDGIVHIKEILLVDSYYQGIPRKAYQVKWTFLGPIETVIDLSSEALFNKEELEYYENEILLTEYEIKQQVLFELQTLLDEQQQFICEYEQLLNISENETLSESDSACMLNELDELQVTSEAESSLDGVEENTSGE